MLDVEVRGGMLGGRGCAGGLWDRVEGELVRDGASGIAVWAVYDVLPVGKCMRGCDWMLCAECD